MTVETLCEHGISPNDIQKLKDAGYNTVESVSRLTWMYVHVVCAHYLKMALT